MGLAAQRKWCETGYNTLLRGYGRRGDFLKAEYWMRRMRARGVAPDMFSRSMRDSGLGYGRDLLCFADFWGWRGFPFYPPSQQGKPKKCAPNNTLQYTPVPNMWSIDTGGLRVRK